MNDYGYTILGMVSILVFVLSIVPIVGGLLHVRRERTLAHLERMKALELGRDLPDDVATARIKAALGGKAEEESAASKCFSTSFWVAFWGFGAAAGLGGSHVGSGIAYAIAASTGAIGVTAMICGTILAARASIIAPAPGREPKARFEDDALDVVSCRG